MELSKEILNWLVNNSWAEEREIDNYPSKSSVILGEEASRLFGNGFRLGPIINALYKVMNI